jgi:hypothetical protein
VFLLVVRLLAVYFGACALAFFLVNRFAYQAGRRSPP